MQDLQGILAIAVVLGAALYLGRRGWVVAARAVRQRRGRDCASGCGCGQPD
jgi:hypothetical protein